MAGPLDLIKASKSLPDIRAWWLNLIEKQKHDVPWPLTHSEWLAKPGNVEKLGMMEDAFKSVEPGFATGRVQNPQHLDLSTFSPNLTPTELRSLIEMTGTLPLPESTQNVRLYTPNRSIERLPLKDFLQMQRLQDLKGYKKGGLTQASELPALLKPKKVSNE